MECKGLCQEYCGPVPVSKRERTRIQRAAGRKVIVDENAACPYLSEEGACTVYKLRPLMCRLWGIAEGIRCPHGCVPERPVSRQEALQMATELGIENSSLLAELRGDAIAGYEAKLRRRRG
jgi:hypothetical protein